MTLVVVSESSWGGTAYAYTNDLSPAGSKGSSCYCCHGGPGQGEVVVMDLRRRTPSFDSPILVLPESVPVADKVAVVEKVNSVARKIDTKVRQVTVAYRDVVQKITIANSEGVWVEDERIRTNLSMNVIAVE